MAGNVPVRPSDAGAGSQMAQRRQTGGLFADLLGFDPLRSLVPPLANVASALGVDISRTQDGYVVEIPVPGFTPDQIEVTVQDDTLMVSGKSDRRSFTRQLILPEEIDPDQISAVVENGLLTLRLPRRPESQPRRIAVQTSSSAQTGAPVQAGAAAGSQRSNGGSPAPS
jgi:HSP20 family protein